MKIVFNTTFPFKANKTHILKYHCMAKFQESDILILELFLQKFTSDKLIIVFLIEVRKVGQLR